MLPLVSAMASTLNDWVVDNACGRKDDCWEFDRSFAVEPCKSASPLVCLHSSHICRRAGNHHSFTKLELEALGKDLQSLCICTVLWCLESCLSTLLLAVEDWRFSILLENRSSSCFLAANRTLWSARGEGDGSCTHSQSLFQSSDPSHHSNNNAMCWSGTIHCYDFHLDNISSSWILLACPPSHSPERNHLSAPYIPLILVNTDIQKN